MVSFALISLCFSTLYIACDLTKNNHKHWSIRINYYSFFIYIYYVLEYTIGSLGIPRPLISLENWHHCIQPIPLRFWSDLQSLYEIKGMNWEFWNYFKQPAYNILLLMPLGIYCPLLFGIKKLRYVAIVTFLISLLIEITQLFISVSGLARNDGARTIRTFDVDDLILNTLGGIIGFLAFKLIIKLWQSYFPNSLLQKALKRVRHSFFSS